MTMRFEKMILLFLFFLAGCASRKIYQSKPFSSAEFSKDQSKRIALLEKLNAKLSLSLKSSKNSVSGLGRFWSGGHRRAKLELRDPLGRVQYSLSMNEAELTAYYPSESKVYVDREEGRLYSKEFFGIKISFSVLKDLWFGVLPGVSESVPVFSWDPGAQQFVSRFERDGGKWEVWMHPTKMALEKVRAEFSGQSLHFQFSDFEDCCEGLKLNAENVVLARGVEARFGEKDFRLSVDWEEVQPLKKDLPTDFFRDHVDPKVSRIALKP